jgi:hypothetical protein
MADSILDDQTLKALRDYARQTGQSVEQLARQAVERYLSQVGQTAPDGPQSPLEDPLLALSGIGRSGQVDISEHTNEILQKEIDPQHGWTFKRDRTD